MGVTEGTIRPAWAPEVTDGGAVQERGGGGRRPWWRVPLVVTAVVVPLYVLWAAVLATGGGDLAAQFAWAGFMARHPGSAYNLSQP